MGELLDEVRALAAQVQAVAAGLLRLDALLDLVLDELLEAA